MFRLRLYLSVAVPYLLLALAGCAATPPLAGDPGAPPLTEAVYVIAGGWHTEIGLPTQLIRGPLASMKQAFPRARYLVFGWGARAYYMARDPGIGDLLRATIPGPAVMLVIPLEVPPENLFGAANAMVVRVSQNGLDRLSQFLWDQLAKDPEGMPTPAGAGSYPQSVFYVATGTYKLSYTCNTWTAEALHLAGLPVTATGVVFAGQVLDQLPHLRIGPAATTSDQGISYTANSSAIPRNARLCATGLSPLVSSKLDDWGCLTTGPVARIERESARPCTRAAMLTVRPK
jgi:uncharacterized protein (TIGR02117 family)